MFVTNVPIIALVVAMIAAVHQESAKRSWWDRTGPVTSQHATHRVRSDCGEASTLAAVNRVDAVWRSVADAFGTLRPRELAPQDLLLFAKREDLDDTVRSQLGVEVSGPAFAFYSPLGHGIAICEEDSPSPVIERGIAAAAASEYLRLTCGGDLPPAMREGLADLIARSGRAGDGARGGIGAAGVACVGEFVASGGAIPLRELLRIPDAAWTTRRKAADGHKVCEEAASFVRFLAQLPKGALATYLRGVSGGMSSDQSLANALGVRTDADWEQLDGRWREYAKLERASAVETVRERLAFLADGLQRLDAEGATPASAADLGRDLSDRKHVFPSAWAPGFSRVTAADEGVFTPALGLSDDAPRRRGSSPVVRKGAFTLVAPQGTARVAAAPIPEVHVEGAKPRLKVSWHRTRNEPEAPWVWSIVPLD